MAAPLTVKTLTGDAPKAGAITYGNPAVPLNVFTLLALLDQVVNTLNELISRHNQLCTDTAHPGDAVTGAGAAATNLFTSS